MPQEWLARLDAVIGAFPQSYREKAWVGQRWRVGAATIAHVFGGEDQRLRIVFRGEPEEVTPAALEAGPVRMDVDRHVVTVSGGKVDLPLKEFDLLEYLLRNPDRVLTRSQIIDRVWGPGYLGDSKTLDVHVKRLRSKIEADPKHPAQLLTVRGLGYKFES